LKIFQTFYYTRAVTLIPSLAQYANEAGKDRNIAWIAMEPVRLYRRSTKGFFGGASIFFDFENRRVDQRSPMISSLFLAGYAYDCCALTVQYYTFNVGTRFENRISFGFRLNGIGAVGTEQFGQGIK
jgi:hypothetical protein